MCPCAECGNDLNSMCCGSIVLAACTSGMHMSSAGSEIIRRSDQGNLIWAGREGSRFFLSLSIFEIERCFTPLFGSLGLFTNKKKRKIFEVFLVLISNIKLNNKEDVKIFQNFFFASKNWSPKLPKRGIKHFFLSQILTDLKKKSAASPSKGQDQL